MKSYRMEDLSDADKVRYSLARRSPDRMELLKRYTGGKEPTYADIVAVRQFLKALARTVGSRRKTTLKGLGVLEWRPWKGRTPTVANGKSWRLTFQRTRSERNYNGRAQ